jgi:beta-fructofuranosidase
VEVDIVKAGEFRRIYDPSVGESGEWYINDHCFARGVDGTWHLIGITHAEPENPQDETDLAHATASGLTQSPWKKQPFALSADYERWRESIVWAPHVVEHQGARYMYYCAGDEDDGRYKIHLATSLDLWNWTRHPDNPMVVGGYHTRDPMVLKVGDEWIIYYTATSDPTGGNHIIAYQRSKDLVHWSD